MTKLLGLLAALALAALLARIPSARPAPVGCNMSANGAGVAVNCTSPVPYRVEVAPPGAGGNAVATVTF